MDKEPLKLTVSLHRKIPMEQYGSAEAFISIQGITEDTTDAEIALLIEKGGLGYKAMSEGLNAKIAEFRKGL